MTGHLAIAAVLVAAGCAERSAGGDLGAAASSPGAHPTRTAPASPRQVVASASASGGEPVGAGRPAELGSAERPVRVAFVGDVALALHVGIYLDKRARGEPVPARLPPGYPFDGVADRLRAADLLVGNLECVLSDKGKLSTDHNPFRCPLVAADHLREAGFDLVSVANNHAQDFGPRAFADMLDNLARAGLPYFGTEAFWRRPQAATVRVLGGIRIGLLAYYYPPARPYRDVTQARPTVDVLVTFMHWGKEDQVEPLALQEQVSRELVDAGVDLVVGTHAHVPQPAVWYRGRLLALGLGNFVFDGMQHSELHRTGLVLEADLERGKGIVAHRLLTVKIDRDGAPRFVGDPDRVSPLVVGTDVPVTVPAAPRPVPPAAGR